MSGSGITFEVVSAKGILKLKHSYIKSLRAHVVFGSETRSSDDVIDTLEEDTIFNFVTSFNVECTLHDLKHQNKPFYVYISESVHASMDEENTSLDFQPVGSSFSRTLIAQAVIDSRLTYVHNDEYLSVELVACNAGGVIDTGFSGVLFLRCTATGVLSSLCRSLEGTDIEDINNAIENNQRQQEKMNYEQYQTLKAWFANCRAAYPYIEDRKIKLIALDECGRHRMACNFVGSIPPSRDIDSPRFAARLVSLIPFHRSIELVGGNLNSWNSPFSTLLALQGDVEDHAILLCSLLLGWGMDAWVAYGTIFRPTTAQHKHEADGEALQHYHYWVVTLDELSTTSKSDDQSGIVDSASRSVLFWEPLTGQQFRIPVKSQKHFFTLFSGVPLTEAGDINNRKHPFRYIYALFRNDSFFVNLQQHPNISYDADAGTPMASFDLSNKKLWARLANPNFDILKHPGVAVTIPIQMTLTRHAPNFLAIAEQVEAAVLHTMVSIRKELGLQTYVDKRLSFALQPALVAYEFDRAVGCSFGNDDFQTSIKRCVKSGETFKAYPTCFPFVHIPSIKAILTRTAAFQDVVRSSSKQGFIYSESQTTSDSIFPTTRHGLRVKIVEYSGLVCAVWILVAVCYER